MVFKYEITVEQEGCEYTYDHYVLAEDIEQVREHARKYLSTFFGDGVYSRDECPDTIRYPENQDIVSEGLGNRDAHISNIEPAPNFTVLDIETGEDVRMYLAF